jgi:hypothetical protein
MRSIDSSQEIPEGVIQILECNPFSASVAFIDFLLAKPGHRDGPFCIRQWCWQGKISNSKMTEKQDGLARYLWERIDRRIPIRNLIGKNLLFENVEESTVQRHGSNVSAFFVREEIPLSVESAYGDIWMTRTRTEE